MGSNGGNTAEWGPSTTAPTVGESGGGGAAADSSMSPPALDLGEKILDPLRSTVFNNCPDGLCAVIQEYSKVVLVLVAIIGIFFFLTLVPPVFSWSRRKPDGKKRVAFAFLACVTFYFWLVFLIVNSAYCFGFLAHEGPCMTVNRTAVAEEAAAAEAAAAAAEAAAEANATVLTPSVTDDASTPKALATTALEPHTPEEQVMRAADEASSTLARSGRRARRSEQPLVLAVTSAEEGGLQGPTSNESCSTLSPHEEDLRNLTCTNILIIVVLIIVLVANAKEGTADTLSNRQWTKWVVGSLLPSPHSKKPTKLVGTGFSRWRKT